ncbi:MAG: transglutaminase-like domain-containing protein, partial [Algiphilus sp.]
TFSLRARVERELLPPVLDMSPRPAALADELASIRSLASDAPVHFIGASPLVPAIADIADYARACVRPEMSAFDAVRAVGAALHADLRYDSEATEVDTPIREAFAQRHGVCQDFSHIMLGALRAIGIPAGYVSGFLRTEPPPGQPRLEGADAMHAWVRAWCGFEMGWVEYDPTNDLMVSADHVVIAYGRDYSDIAPVRGSFRSSGSHTSEQAVDVLPIEA